MSKNPEEEATIAIADFIVIPIVFLLGLFIIASVVEFLLTPNIESFKLIFITIAGTPLFILYFREKLTKPS